VSLPLIPAGEARVWFYRPVDAYDSLNTPYIRMNDAIVGTSANFGVSDRRFRFKPAGGFGGNRQAVSVQSGTPLRMGFGPDFGEPPLRDTSYLALVCQSKYSCHYYRL
jgi:hypothetical protein